MKLKIAILPGDGIGPEVTNESIKVLNCIAKKFNHDVEMSTGSVGAIAIDEYNDPYPNETHKLCSESDAILFGAIGDPKYDNDPKAKIRPEQGLLKLRKKLGTLCKFKTYQSF
jgi:3-isopropylmalate dehydrogenase